MKICHVCKAECEDYAELCSVCGADLTTETNKALEKQDVINEPVLLVSIEDVVSAEIFKDILKDNNIPFSCDERDNGGAMQVLFGGSFVACNIYVDNSNYEAANNLYSDFLESEENFETEFLEGDFEEEE